MKQFIWIGILVMVGWSAQAQADVAFVQKVLSADVFQTLEGEEVKLIGVNIPELKPDISIHSQARMSNNPQHALDYARSLISGANVEIRIDAKERDEEGRILAYVWFLYPDDNYMSALEFADTTEVNRIVDEREYGQIVFLNAALIKAGYAAPEKDEFNHSFSALFNSIYHERNIQAVQNQEALESEIELQASVK